MARTKTVFGATGQTCHVWAQQTVEHGRNSQGNVYFRGADIYSYGSHFHAARIHTIRGNRVALLQSNSYSSTTSQHMSHIRRALRGLMPMFDSPDPTSLKAAVGYADTLADRQITDVLKRVKVENTDAVASAINRITEAFADANELRRLMGRAERNPKPKDMAAVRAHLLKRLERYRELNTPEIIAKRKAKADALESERQRVASLKQSEAIAEWRNGNPSANVYGLSYELLRVKGNTVETSRGAEVPLTDAQKLYRALCKGMDIVGQRVGHFTVNEVRESESDKVIQIGCHTILLSEAARILGQNGPKRLQIKEQS